GLLALLRKILTVVDVVKRAYSKVAEAVNAGLAKLDITKQGWFDAFSMAYAAVVHAVKTIENPGPALSKASEALKDLVGGFFQAIKEKIADIASGIKTGLDLAGKGEKLIADLADKAVEMVVNFLIKHNPSALIKTALSVLEPDSNKSVAELRRTEVKYGDDILKAISESSVVRTLLSPLERPIAAVSEMTDSVAEEATSVVSSVEKEALSLVGDGAKMVTELAGNPPQAGGSEAAAAAGAPAAPAGGGGGDASTFLGALKEGIRAGLLELGTASLIKHGKQLGKAAVEKGKEVGKAALEKGKAAAKGLLGKVLGRVVPFNAHGKQHELWVEQQQGRAVVLMASDTERLRKIIRDFEIRVDLLPDGDEKDDVAKHLRTLKQLNETKEDSATRDPNDVARIDKEKDNLVREVRALLEVTELGAGLKQEFHPPRDSRFTIHPRIYRNTGRDIVVVYTPDGPRAFYKRTGGGGADEGWAAKGNWAPFSGFLRHDGGEWFIKPRAGRRRGAEALNEEISKFVGNELGTGEVVLGEEEKEIRTINAWLRANGVEVGGGYRVGDKLKVKKKGKTVERTVIEIP